MYETFYGLKERPFELTPNPRYLCRMPRHREALANLECALATARGLTLLIGDAGTGKTTLLRTALRAQADSDAICVTVNNPTLGRPEFLQILAEGFRLGPAAAASKATFLREFETLLRQRHETRRVTALVIDEAQSLSSELLEEVRLLANIETDEHKLLTVILAGQPELADRLNEPGLRQLKQRVSLRCSLAPLDLAETAAYMSSRIRVAGGDSAKLFTRQAVEVIHRRSGGIPRTISVICDNALMSGFAVGERPVSSRLVAEVCDDFDLQTQAPVEPAAVPSMFTVANAPAAELTTPVHGPADAVTPVVEEPATPVRRRRFSFF